MKPAPLDPLIEELRGEIEESSVGSAPDSYAKIEDVKNGLDFELNRQECEAVFHSPSTVRCFFETIGSPDEAVLELHELMLSAEVLEALERRFTAVDEL